MIQRITFQLLLATFLAVVVSFGLIWSLGAMMRRSIETEVKNV